MFFQHFVDLAQRVEIFEKKGATVKRNINFEMGDSGTSTHLHWGLKKFSSRVCLLFYCFFGSGKKSSLHLHVYPLIIEFFRFF